MSQCEHPDLTDDGYYPRDSKGGVWTLVKLYTCRACHKHFLRQHEMHVDKNYIEVELIHGTDNRLQAVRSLLVKGNQD